MNTEVCGCDGGHKTETGVERGNHVATHGQRESSCARVQTLQANDDGTIALLLPRAKVVENNGLATGGR